MGKVTMEPTAGLTREDWLELRRHSIGGSDAAAIVGLNPWASPYTVWAEKTGLLPEKPDTEAMRQGRDLEDYVAQRFCEATGYKVRRVNGLLKNADYPYSHAAIDRAIVGQKAGLECKTTSTLDVKPFHGQDFPTRYYCQCVHYLAVTGWERWHLAVLVLGREFHVFTLERDEDEIRALMEAEGDFWETYVLRNQAPPLDGADPTSEAVNAIYPEADGGCIELLGYGEDLQELARLKDLKKEVEQDQKAIENRIKQHMGDTEKATCGDRWRISWANQTRRTLDAGLLLADYPELDLSPYYRESVSRVFKVKEVTA